MQLDHEEALLHVDDRVDAPDVTSRESESYERTRLLRYERSWNLPSGLEPNDEVSLAFAWFKASRVEVRFNGECLFDGEPAELDPTCLVRQITHLLSRHNHVQIDLHCDGPMAATLGEVAVWIESTSA